MKSLLGFAVLAAMALLVLGADAATATKKKTPAKKAASKTVTPKK